MEKSQLEAERTWQGIAKISDKINAGTLLQQMELLPALFQVLVNLYEIGKIDGIEEGYQKRNNELSKLN